MDDDDSMDDVTKIGAKKDGDEYSEDYTIEDDRSWSEDEYEAGDTAETPEEDVEDEDESEEEEDDYIEEDDDDDDEDDPYRRGGFY
mgnify:FL=1